MVHKFGFFLFQVGRVHLKTEFYSIMQAQFLQRSNYLLAHRGEIQYILHDCGCSMFFWQIWTMKHLANETEPIDKLTAKVYNIYHIVFIFWLPFLVLFFCYVLIMKDVYKTLQSEQDLSRANSMRMSQYSMKGASGSRTRTPRTDSQRLRTTGSQRSLKSTSSFSFTMYVLGVSHLLFQLKFIRPCRKWAIIVILCSTNSN